MKFGDFYPLADEKLDPPVKLHFDMTMRAPTSYGPHGTLATQGTHMIQWKYLIIENMLRFIIDKFRC